MPTDMLITNNALPVQIITRRHLLVSGATAKLEALRGVRRPASAVWP